MSSASQFEVLDFPLFRTVLAASQGRLRRGMVIAPYMEGQIVYELDDDAQHVFFVLSGIVKDQNFGSDGQLVHIKRYTPGDYFGFGSAFTKGNRICRATANTEAVLGKLRYADFVDIFLADPTLTLDLCRRFALFEREAVLIRTGEHILHIQDFVAFDLMRRRAVLSSDEIEVPPRDEWAAYLSTTRESLSRALSDLRKENLIEVIDNIVRIRDPDKLDAYVKGGAP